MSELSETRLATLEEKVAVLASQNAALQTEVLHLRAAVADSGKVRKNEDYYQSLLSARMNAGHMSITGVGTTDITTADAHIEIKKWSGYHEVIGQLAKYNRAVKRPRLCVYFFGPEPRKERYEQILDLMTEANIEMYSFDASDEVKSHKRVANKSPPEIHVDEFHQTCLIEAPGAIIKWTDILSAFRSWSAQKRYIIPEKKAEIKLLFENKLRCNSKDVRANGVTVDGWKNLGLKHSD